MFTLTKILALLTMALLLDCGSLASAQTIRATVPGTVVAASSGTQRLAAGLQVSVKLNEPISSKTAAEGDAWAGVLAKDLVVAGRLLTPSGTQVTGVVSQAISAARAHGSGTLALRLTSIHGSGVSSTPVLRQGANSALGSTGTVASAGIPGESKADVPGTAGPGQAGSSPQALAEARYGQGAVLTFTTQ